MNERLPRAQVPFPPRRNHRDIRLEGVIGKLEAHLVVAFAGRSVSDGVGTDLLRNLDLALRDEGPCDGSAEQVLALIERIGAEHGKYVIANELLAQILDKDVFRLDAQEERLVARRLELLALAKIGGKGDYLAAIRGLQPFENDRGIEPAGIGEHHFFHAAVLRIGFSHRLRAHLWLALVPSPDRAKAKSGLRDFPRKLPTRVLYWRINARACPVASPRSSRGSLPPGSRA